MSDSPEQLFDVVRRFFVADDWPFEELGGQSLRTSFGGDNGQWTVVVETKESYQRVVCFSLLPDNAPEAARPAVAEYIARVNYGVSLGSFELDFDHGDIRYKTSIDVTGATLTEPLVKQLVYGNVLTVDTFLAGLRAVIEEGLSPSDALTR